MFEDSTAVHVDGGRAVITAVEVSGAIVDDAYEWGRIAATSALSRVYAVGGRPVVAVNLVGWPDGSPPAELPRGGRDVCAAAGCHLAGGRRIGDAPTYGLAVTGLADPDRLLRKDTGRAGQPLSITKPLGLGALNRRHKETGEWFAEAIDVMTTVDAAASAAAVRAGIRCATSVGSDGLLADLRALARASNVTVVLDAAAIPVLDGVDDDMATLLTDPQPAGGLLLAGEIDGAPVIGELVAPIAGEPVIVR
jgi:selenide, water dikinase